MAKKYIVTLTTDERSSLLSLLSLGQGSTRKLTHARILLKADQGPEGPGWTDEQISQAVEVSLSTIERARERFVLAGLSAALTRRASSNPRTCKMDGAQEARLIALSCGPAPAGHKDWTLRLLAERMVSLGYIDTISHETVRQMLKKTNSNPG
jgi:transposase